MESWLQRASKAASEIEGLILDQRSVSPKRSENGKGIEHMLFMARAIQTGDCGIDSETKACRWLGYLQAMLVYEGLSDLDDEKKRNMLSKKDS